MNSTGELVLMIASVIMTGIILLYVYGFRRERGIRYLIGLIVCRMIYASCIMMEKGSDLLAYKLIFHNIQSAALNAIVPFFLLFVFQLTGRATWMKLRWKILLFSLFALWSLLPWLDSEMHFIYRTIALDHGQLMITRTPYAIAFSVACYVVMAVCFYYLFQFIRNIRGDIRKPAMWVLFLGTFPLVLEIAKLTNPDWSSWLLSLSVYCGFTGTLMLAILLRFKLLSTVPVARSMVLDRIQDSILIANATGKIIDSNIQASQWFLRMGCAVIHGRNMAELLEPWPQWQQLCQSMQQGRVEIDVWLDGESKIYSVNVYPLQILRKQGQGSISLIVDITEKARHLQQIEQLNQLKDQLMAVVSHDIRSPLASQHQLIELLEEEQDRFDPDLWEIVAQLGDQIRQTLGMTNNLLEWFRSQQENMTLHLQLLALSGVVEECCDQLRLSSEAKNIKVKQAIAPDTKVYADREALGLIIRNLLTNAIKYTEPGGTVHIDAQKSEDLIILSVRDHGVGMDEDQIRQLHEGKPLHSLPGTLGEKGSGLGLFVSRQFVQRSGGTLWVDSRLRQGSAFHFTMRGGAQE